MPETARSCHFSKYGRSEYIKRTFTILRQIFTITSTSSSMILGSGGFNVGCLSNVGFKLVNIENWPNSTSVLSSWSESFSGVIDGISWGLSISMIGWMG